MDIAKLHSLVSRLTDQQLAQEAQKPSGMAPLYMVMAELDRRSRMRKGSPQPVQGYADGGPVYDEDWFKYFQETLGDDIAVNSGYRTKEEQERLRRMGLPAARNSYHTLAPGRGQAMDIALPSWLPPSEALRRVRGGSRPLSEAMFHNNHLHVAWGGPKRYGGDTPPPNPMDPAALPEREQTSMADYMAMMGVDPSSPPSLRASHAEAAELMPDRTSPVFAEMMAELQAEKERFARSQRGRPLMEMGIAMMSAKGPNFFNALGQGGAAGLSARDRVQAGERDIMRQIMQGKLAQAQALAARDQSLLSAATGDVGSTRQAMAQAAGLGIGQARAQSDMAASNANMALAREQFAASQRADAARLELERRRVELAERGQAWMDKSGAADLPPQVVSKITSLAKPIAAAMRKDFTDYGGRYKPITGPDGKPIINRETGEPFVWTDSLIEAEAMIRAGARLGLTREQLAPLVGAGMPDEQTLGNYRGRIARPGQTGTAGPQAKPTSGYEILASRPE